MTPFGQVELARTREIVERHLPPAPAVVADVGGGPGRYSLWLAERGYTVRHRDLVTLHVEQLAADAAAGGLTVDSAIGDARALDLPDASVDAVLLLGPLYHLPTREDRVAALARLRGWCGRAGRCLRPPSRAGRRGCDGQVAERLAESIPMIDEAVDVVERTGRLSRSSRGRSAATATGRTSFAARCWPPGSRSSISWAWRGSRLRSPISRSGSPSRRRGRSSSARRGHWSGFRSSWASARTSWRRRDDPRFVLG